MSDAGARPSVVVVGLGPAGPDMTTHGAVSRLLDAGELRLRTKRHPAAEPFGHAESYDEIYDDAATFDEVYSRIVEDLIATASATGQVTYAVPGSPHVLERTTRMLAADDRIELEVVPGLSFLDLAWGRIGVDPVESGVSLVDGHRFAVDAAAKTGPLLVAHCHADHVLSDIKLAFEEDEPEGAVVLARLGLHDEEVAEVDWADLDRAVEVDHLTSLFIPSVATPVANELLRLQDLVRTLRNRCPWDREQTHASLRRYLLEEAYEVAEAIDRLGGADSTADLEEELGDLLYQVFFHSALAAERGEFTVADVARGIHDKLYRRHPHVFGPDAGERDADSVESDWEAIKKAEKGRGSVMDGIPEALPGLLYAHKVLSRAERIGAPVPSPVDPEGELGAALLGLVAHARATGADAEASLRSAAASIVEAARHHESGQGRRASTGR